MARELYSSGAKWEDLAGYSRAIKVGKTIEVAGTTSVLDNNIIGKGDIYLQTKTCLDIIAKAIRALGGDITDVVRTRIYITDINQWEAAAKAHGEVFKNIKPATTLIEISNLIDPDLLIEIEATAQLN